MRHIQRAAYGMFVAGILVSGISAEQAQAGPASPSGFKNRFYFQPDAPGRSTPDSEQLRNRLKQLLISAEAQTARQHVAPPPEEASRTRGQTSKNSLVGKHVFERPIVVGRAAFYEHSGRTATGERYNPDGLTAAHRTLALGTRLRVVNLQNRKSVIVQVTERSPRKMKFSIDLSRGSAKALVISKRVGTALVAVYKVSDTEVNQQ